MCHDDELFFRETAHFIENRMAAAEKHNVIQRWPHILKVVRSSSDLLHGFVLNKHVPKIKSLISQKSSGGVAGVLLEKPLSTPPGNHLYINLKPKNGPYNLNQLCF